MYLFIKFYVNQSPYKAIKYIYRKFTTYIYFSYAEEYEFYIE